ncbi:uncharacterized protein LOC110445735 [Mizuhopecten yessoensis]|uniref:uncharacterized protein LOC110445735 n=1 Tax=Mizuhopecten yessoensis TaxID=6573 RepID=UPI000B4577E6|nr:uncharacterized protein LOC110445735 [Mizuhopecten yessoensis]
MALMAYRSAEHSSTKFSPNEMMLGREVRLPVDLIYGTLPREADNNGSVPQFVSKLVKYLDSAHDLARQNIKDSSEKQKGHYDYRTNTKSYKTGDAVWLHDPKRRVGISPKLQSNWDGPYLIVNCLSDLVFRIQKTPSSKPRVVHFNRLKSYHGDYKNWLTTQEKVLGESNFPDDRDFASEHGSITDDDSECADGRGKRLSRPPDRYGYI